MDDYSLTAQALRADILLHYRNTAFITAARAEKEQMTLESRIDESHRIICNTENGVEMYGGFTRSNNSILQKLSKFITKYVSRMNLTG